MRKTILALLTSILTISAYGQHTLHYLQNIGNDAIIIFPDTPRITQGVTSISYEVDYYDMMYAANSSSVEGGSVDFLYRDFTNSLYRRSIAKFIKTIHGKLIYKKDIIVDGVKGIEFECHGNLDTAGYYIFYRFFYYNKRFITEGIWFKQEAQRNDERLNAFFSTFKFIRKAEHNNSVWSNKTLVIKGVKYALIIILLITLIVGSIIFIARRLSAKKLKNE
ncbi:MAG: hypothetical protein JST50_19910 [Bacteroidetes bacterium]|jgi:hypothetical protein|nr:hypothetical protein [Bacteroidota bacterium]